MADVYRRSDRHDQQGNRLKKRVPTRKQAPDDLTGNRSSNHFSTYEECIADGTPPIMIPLRAEMPPASAHEVIKQFSTYEERVADGTPPLTIPAGSKPVAGG